MEEILTPQYRIEDYWYAIANGLSCPHTPIYRIETYLAYLCGADVQVPQPIYRIEQYLAYKCGLDVELPAPIYRQEMFLAKWCGMDVEPPAPIYRIEVLLSQLSNGYLHTETGNPISVSDALAKPAESLTIEILPYQSGSGDPSPDNVRPISGFTGCNVTRTGKNLFDNSKIRKYSGANRFFKYGVNDYADTTPNGDCILGSGTYTFSVQGDSIVNAQSISVKDANGSQVAIVYNNSVLKFTVQEEGAYIIAFNFNDVIDFDNYNFQLEVSSTATAYEPYTGTTYSIDWTDEAGTVYGGELDVTTGVLTVTNGYVAFDGSDDESLGAGSSGMTFRAEISGDIAPSQSTALSGVICNQLTEVTQSSTWGTSGTFSRVSSYANRIFFKIDDDITTVAGLKTYLSEHPLTFVYPLANLTAYQLTATQVDMLLGNNVLWNDVDGDMTLEYLADGPAEDIDALQILLGNRYVNNGGADEATDREALDILLGGNTR